MNRDVKEYSVDNGRYVELYKFCCKILVVVFSFTEIMDGSVMFHNNYELCYEDTIDWTDILTGEDANVFFKDDDTDQVSRSCKL
jgi:Receptor L domain